MERLTVNVLGRAFYNDVETGLKLGTGEIDMRRRRLLLDALEKYEDTGLTPEEVQDLKERDTAKAPKVIVNKNDVKIGAITFKSGTKVYKCPNCGRLVPYRERFCRYCGKSLKWED